MKDEEQAWGEMQWQWKDNLFKRLTIKEKKEKGDKGKKEKGKKAVESILPKPSEYTLF